MTGAEPGPPLRVHQREALQALASAWSAGRRRAWVAMPPGAGKTRVGLEAVRERVAASQVVRAVVLGPNTAIQGQWHAAAGALGLDVGTDRDLTHVVTALTYQAVAVFDDADRDSDADSDGDSDADTSVLGRLHDRGRELVEAMRHAGPLLLVLDECHHLLDVWGRLLAELLAELPDALVLGLTATPPEALTQAQAALVDELFGEPLYRVSIPAVVRTGDLAPFVELAWVTEPTAAEQDWLAEEASRFQELVTQLTDPTFGSVPFLAWLDARFVAGRTPWLTLTRESPDLCRAALRLHHAGLLGLPTGARVSEENRQDPTADDWVLLVDDWLTGRLTSTGLAQDDQVVEAVRRALPSVGYVWTRRGIRRGRSPVDRVLARSGSKAVAVVQIADQEHRNLGDRLRMLVLCDHELAGATLPVDLTGVLDQQSGSARALLAALVAAPETATLAPMLVTGRTVAAAPDTLAAFLATLPDRDLAGRLRIEPLDAGRDGSLAQVVGPWESRRWVGLVTSYFESGGTRVLVGTRALLGEGWDARWVTGLADVTAVTTSTAVVQTRGRSLRSDPRWPDKVAVNWSLVCVSDRHPKGGNDWDRLVRKHTGYFGLDVDGEIVDGVAHLDPAYSPFAPPPVADRDAGNARALVRSEQRNTVRDQWRVGEPYADMAVQTVRIRQERVAGGAVPFGPGAGPATVVMRPTSPEVRGVARPSVRDRLVGLVAGVGVAVAVVAGLVGAPLVLAGGAVVAVAAAALRARAQHRYGEALLRGAEESPSVLRIASAVADGLHTAGLLSVGAEAVRVTFGSDAEYRCLVTGVPPAEAGTFATALDEAVSPIGLPRYLLPRYVRTRRPRTWWRGLGAGFARVRPDGVVWHAVPTVLGVNRERAAAYAVAWDHWVGGGQPVYSGSPEGVGILAAQQGTDTFAASTVMRRQWS